MERRGGPNDRRRRKHRHAIAIPDSNMHPVKYRLLQLRWRVALWAVVYPVQLAVLVALLVCTIPVWMLIGVTKDLRRQQHAVQVSRRDTTRDLCAQLDRNARTVNAQLSLYQGIIINGAKQSRAFDNLYRKFGQPSYKVRLKTARRTAADINKLRLPLPNCSAAVRRVSNSGG